MHFAIFLLSRAPHIKASIVPTVYPVAFARSAYFQPFKDNCFFTSAIKDLYIITTSVRFFCADCENLFGKLDNSN